MVEEILGDSVVNLHFDEAWLPHATFHEFYKGMHPQIRSSQICGFSPSRARIHDGAGIA